MVRLPRKYARQWDMRTLRLIDGVYESRIGAMKGQLRLLEYSAYSLLTKWAEPSPTTTGEK